MKAANYDRYGSPRVIQVADVPTPSPGKDEVLVRVAAVAVTSADSRIRAARFPGGFAPFARLAFGVFRPRRKILGSTFSGVVESVGSGADEFSPGDEVCGMNGIKMGAHAEYVTVKSDKLVTKPAEVSHVDAAGMLFGGTTALSFLKQKVTIEPGATLLVNGASGAVGTNAVQLAKHFGADVTAVTSERNTGLATELGADRVIDYNATPVAGLDERFDYVFDTVGNISRSVGTGLLTAEGVLLLAVADLRDTITPDRKVKSGPIAERTKDFKFLLDLIAEENLVSVTEELGGLETIVAAYELVDSGHKVGNLVIRP
jgi:NADPH:quinone reductase-like Zn-dependent oxidoreductase